MKKLFLAVVCTLLCVSTYAQSSEFEKEVAKSIELMNTRQTMIETMMMQYSALANNGQLKSEKVRVISEECVDAMLPKLTEVLMSLYKEHYTIDELKELNKFYASEIGQKNIKLTPIFSMAGAQVATDPEMLEKLQSILVKHMTNNE